MDANSLSLVLMIAAICWLLANAPVAAAILRHRSFAELWLTLTSTPNRYLFSLLFLPGMYVSVFLVWGLARKALVGVPVTEHPVIVVLSSVPALLLSSLAICSLVAFWDYAAGNFNNADLTHPYGIAALKARDALLDLDPATSSPTTMSGQMDLPTVAADLARSGTTDRHLARAYLRQVDSERPRLQDQLMVHTNLVNVWFFALAVWLSAYLLMLLAMAKQAGAITDSVAFDICRYPILFCILNFALWGAMRSYELHEFRESMGSESGEVIDIMIGGFIVVFLCVLASWAFNLGAIELTGAALIPLGFIVGSQFFTSLVRQSLGSAMSFPNFLIVAFLWCVSCGVLTLVFVNSKV